MPINDNKPKNPEDIINEVINTFIGKLGTPPSGSKPSASTIDPVSEVNRLLKKAEASGPNQAAELLQIADRHIRIIELALAYQQ